MKLTVNNVLSNEYESSIDTLMVSNNDVVKGKLNKTAKVINSI